MGRWMVSKADRTSRAVGRSASPGKRVLAAGLGVALLVLVVGCAPAAPAASPAAPAQPPPQVQQIRFLLDFVLDGTHTPYFVARDKGWYREVGLDVELTPGTGSFDTVKLVGAGQAPLGYADAGSMGIGVAQDVPVTMVAMLYQQSPLTIFSLKDRRITQPRDLEGRSVGLASGAAEAKIFPAFVRKNNLDSS